MTQNIDFSKLKFNSEGLIPAIAQDSESGAVLMLAWMNLEALQRTVAKGEAVYFSRSRGEIWHKGATSGNRQRVLDISFDCDFDALLLRVQAIGPACHNGTFSCFETVRYEL
jgi:phosphoribosyl-AMP cyclohydrolase